MVNGYLENIPAAEVAMATAMVTWTATATARAMVTATAMAVVTATAMAMAWLQVLFLVMMKATEFP